MSAALVAILQPVASVPLRHAHLLLAAGLLAACSPPRQHQPGHALPSAGADGLFSFYMDGKYDAAGHPLGARVFEAEQACSPATGELQAEGWGADPALHGAGLLCDLTIPDAGPDRLTLNLRLLTPKTKSYVCTPPLAADGGPLAGDGAAEGGAAADSGAACPAPPEVVTLRVRSASGKQLAEKTMRHDLFRQDLAYQNLWVDFTLWHREAIRVEVSWSGQEPVRIDYLELFRSMRRAVITPASGVPAQGAELAVELLGSPLPADLELSCDGASLDGTLAALTQQGQASRADTEFRSLINAPLQALLESCSAPVHLLARGSYGPYLTEAARTTYLDAPISCGFTPGTVKVLLTGFEPFPAATSRDNSSEQAVAGFDPSTLPPWVSVMQVTLPVEWDTAAAQMADLVQRCQPDAVIGFGQGGSRVEPETVAYNMKDVSDIAGGAPDNRGAIFYGEPVVAGAPAQYSTTLPAEAIARALTDAGIDARTSTDAGRYICNNLFYAIMHQVQGTAVRGGFVHLPRMSRVDAQQRKTLQTVVETVVRLTLQADESRLLEAGFEAGTAGGWALLNSDPQVGWLVADRRAAGGSQYALHYGDPTAGDFRGNDLTPHHGSASSSAVALPAGRHIRLAFDLYMDTESGAIYDRLRVTANGAELWAKDAQGTKVAQKQWQRVELDLSALAGQSVVIAWQFDTVDAIANGGEGVYIDNVVLAAR